MNFDLQLLDKPVSRVFSHILFWAVIIISLTIVFGIKHEQYLESFINTLLYLPAEAFLMYMTLYVLIPKYLLRGKSGFFFAGLFLLFLISGLMARLMQHYVIYPLHNPYWASFPFFYLEKILRNLVVPIAITGVAASIKLFKLWARDNREKLEMEQQKLQAELRFLKSQIHPHFLFNTLNSLYSLTLRNSRKAPEIVMTLSELIHYMLYECNEEKVSLEKEILSLRKYMELESLRYGDRVEVSTSVNGKISDKMISPLLLIPFVENSFTHGVGDSIDQAWINLDISVAENQLKFKLINSIREDDHGNGKIGLENVRKRLNLIYPSKHTLKITKGEDTFLVILILDLNRNSE